MAGGRVQLPVETPRCLLRLPRPEDAEPLFDAVYGDEEVMRYAGLGPHRDVHSTRDLLRRYAEQQHNQGFAMWVVESRADGTLLGECGLQHLAGTADDVEIGCALSAAAWGHGLAVELTTACARLAFTALDLPRVWAVVRPANAASRSVALRLGMRPAGRRTVYGGEHEVYVLDRPEMFAASDDARSGAGG